MDRNKIKRVDIDPRDREILNKRAATAPRKLTGQAQLNLVMAEVGALAETPGARHAFAEIHTIVKETPQTFAGKTEPEKPQS